MKNHITKDSGKRRKFSTGAVRDINEEKGRYELISPIMIERLAKLLQRGAIKYSTIKPINWEEFIEIGRDKCTCQRKESLIAIHTFLTIVKDSVGTVTKDNLGYSIQSLLKDKEIILENGSRETGKERLHWIKNTIPVNLIEIVKDCKQEKQYWLLLAYLLMMNKDYYKSKKINVQSVEVNLLEDFQEQHMTLIMTMKQTKLGGYSVQNVTKESDCLEITKKELEMHSITCNIHRLKISNNNGKTEVFLTGERNWEQGMELSVYMDSGMRHLFKFLEGYRDEDHLVAAIWNLQALLHIEEMINRGLLPKELNDLPNYLPKKKK